MIRLPPRSPRTDTLFPYTTLFRSIEGISRDTRVHAAAVRQLADAIGVPAGEVQERLRSLRDRLAAARSAATVNGSLHDEDKRRHGELPEAQAKLQANEEDLVTLLVEKGSEDRVAPGDAHGRTRAKPGMGDEHDAAQRENMGVNGRGTWWERGVE